jgi:two-component sensor histidine kinase
LKVHLFLITFFLNLNGITQKLKFTDIEQQWMKENPVIYFGYDPNWPPYEIYSSGTYSGICADFIEKISKSTGLIFLPKDNMTWEKSFEELKKNELMMVPGAGITEERKKHLIFTENYIRLPWVIVTKDETKKINHLRDLNNQKVSIPLGYLQEDILKNDFPKIKLQLRKNFSECLQDVSSGRSIATVGSLGSISYFINETGSKDLSIASYTHYEDSKVAFAFPKEQEILRNIIQKALENISISERNKIHSKWISINVQNENDYKKFWEYFTLSLGLVIVIFVVFYFWNKSLRKQIDLRKKIENELSHTLDEVNKQNNDKTILLQEIHHRVKNNLQIIISLLRLQANSHTNKDVQHALNEAIERINSISLVHEHIYKNPNLAEIDLTKYILNLGEELKRIFVRDFEIHLNVNTNSTALTIKPIVPIALILNELYTNSFKYAFQNKSEGNINIELFFEEKKLVLLYSDDGEWFNNSYTRNFGTYLIEIFTEQLNGEFTLNKENHTKYRFEFLDY